MKRVAQIVIVAAVFWLLTLQSGGCDKAPQPPPVLSIESSRGKLLTYGTNEIDRKIIAESLEYMGTGMIASPRSLSVCGEELAIHFGPREAGHFHNSTYEICIKREDLHDYVIWHEFAHAYHTTLPFRMTKEWEELVTSSLGEEVYRPDYFSKTQTFPYKGFITRYGTVNLREDVAEWHEMVKCALTGRVYYFFGMDKNDPIYLAKLDLLLKWGFITAKEHEAVGAMFLKM